jgi:hypothetical protein
MAVVLLAPFEQTPRMDINNAAGFRASPRLKLTPGVRREMSSMERMPWVSIRSEVNAVTLMGVSINLASRLDALTIISYSKNSSSSSYTPTVPGIIVSAFPRMIEKAAIQNMTFFSLLFSPIFSLLILEGSVLNDSLQETVYSPPSIII